jgi:hypothetical protein
MIRYRPLFQVDIAHDYFLSRGDVVSEAQAAAERAALAALWDVASVLEVVPDEATEATLRGHKMIFRPAEGGFFVAVQLDPAANDMRPRIPPVAGFSLTFGLRVKDARFANFTELGAPGTGFYRFGNDVQNGVAATNFLSRPVAAFDPARRYLAGDTFASAAGATFDLFLALRDTGPAAAAVAADWRRIPADTWDPTATYAAGALVLSANRVFRALVDSPGNNLANAADWIPVATLGNQYVTAGDATLPVAGLLNVDVGDLALPQLTIQLFRPNDPLAAGEQTFVSEQGALARVQVDLRGLRPGPYRIEILDAARVLVPGRGFPVYLSREATRGGWFGVIDIVLGSGDYALLAADGTLRAPRYVLRFLNRASRWRYIFPVVQAVGTGADVAPEAGDGRVLVTAAPRPLTRFGGGSRLQADSAATPSASEEILLPAPEVNRVRRETNGWYSETHLANLTVGP